MTLSQRALAANDVPRDDRDRDRLREEWRVAADQHIILDDRYQRLKEGKSIFFDELVEGILDQSSEADGKKKIAVETARRMANTCAEHKDYLRRLHDARLAAARQRVEVEDRDRLYWSHVSREATERKERGMSR